jgi:hypothetical protein
MGLGLFSQAKPARIMPGLRFLFGRAIRAVLAQRQTRASRSLMCCGSGAPTLDGKCGQPYGHDRRVVVNNVVETCRAFKRGDRSHRCVLNVHPRPNSRSRARNWIPLFQHLMSCVPVWPEPCTGPVKESITKSDSFQTLRAECAIFKFSICPNVG